MGNQSSAYYEEHKIPPDKKEMEDFKKSTWFGKDKKGSSNICASSGLSLDNEKFSILSKASGFSLNGHGYSLFYKILKFGLYGILATLLPLAIVLMLIYASGNDCGSSAFTDPNIKSVLITHSMESSKPWNKQPSFDNGKELTEFGNFEQETNRAAHRYFNLGGFVSAGGSATYLYNNFIQRYFDEVCDFGEDSSKKIIDSTYTGGKKNTKMKQKYKEICKYYLTQKKKEIQGETVVQEQLVEGKTINVTRALKVYDDLSPYIAFYEKENVYGRCQKSFFNEISLTNRYENLDRETFFDSLLPWLHVITVIIMIGGVFGFEYWHEKYCIQLDEQKVTIGDYTLMIINLPHGPDFKGYPLRNNLEKYIRYGSTQNKVAEINFVYDTQRYDAIKEKFGQELKEEYKKAVANGEGSGIQLKSIDSQSKKKNDPIDENERILQRSSSVLTNKTMKGLEVLKEDWEEKFRNDSIEHMVGVAFVSFKQAKYRDYFYDKFRRKGILYQIFGCCDTNSDRIILPVKDELWQPVVKLAPEPNDIIWDDLRYTRKQKLLRKILGRVIEIIVVILGFLVLYQLKTSQLIETLEEKKFDTGYQPDTSTMLISLAVALVISLIGLILKIIIKIISKWEKTGSITAYHYRVATRLWKAQFLIMAIVPFVISSTTINFLSEGGLVEEMHIIFIMNLFVPHLVNLIIEPDIWVKFAQRYFLNKFMKRIERYEQGESGAAQEIIKGGVYTQKEANGIVCALEYDISDHYAYIFSTIATGFFYFTIFPFGIVYVLLSIVIMYWSSKYILVTRCHKLTRYTRKLSRMLVSEFEVCIIFYSLGLWVEENISRISNGRYDMVMSKSTAFCVVFSLIIFLVDSHNWMNRFLPKGKLPNHSYSKMITIDKNHYKKSNPATEIYAKKIQVEKNNRWF